MHPSPILMAAASEHLLALIFILDFPLI